MAEKASTAHAGGSSVEGGSSGGSSHVLKRTTARPARAATGTCACERGSRCGARSAPQRTHLNASTNIRASRRHTSGSLSRLAYMRGAAKLHRLGSQIVHAARHAGSIHVVSRVVIRAAVAALVAALRSALGEAQRRPRHRVEHVASKAQQPACTARQRGVWRRRRAQAGRAEEGRAVRRAGGETTAPLLRRPTRSRSCGTRPPRSWSRGDDMQLPKLARRA